MGAKLRIDASGWFGAQALLGYSDEELRKRATDAVTVSAELLKDELVEQITNDSELTEEGKQGLIDSMIKNQIFTDPLKATARVGWKFDNSQVVDEGRVAQFVSYGTKERIAGDGISRGKITGRQFISRAVKRKAKVLRQTQQEIFFKEFGK